jgi:hypothetical protein
MMENKFKVKKAEAEILETLYTTVQEKLESAYKDYRKTGTQEQDKDWRTGELLWEDAEQTVPQMKDVWAFVNIPEEELNEDQIATVKACNNIMAYLEKLL